MESRMKFCIDAILLQLMNISLQQWINCIALLMISYSLYWLLCVPLNRVRRAHQIGFKHLELGDMTNLQFNDYLCTSRFRGNMPKQAFPRGWYVLAESRQIKKGKILYLSALGKQFVLFRGEDSGQIFVSGAYCPHLGANLAVGGKVQGDCIVCPFHQWKFDGKSGYCVHIPYSKSKIPSNARLGLERVLERNELIYIWYACRPNLPEWMPPPLPQLSQWRYRGRTDYEVSCHISELPENGADVAHLAAIHTAPILAGGEPNLALATITQKLVWHEFDVVWNPSSSQKHVAIVDLEQRMKLWPSINLLKLKVVAEQIGPSFVHLHMSSCFGDCLMIQYVLPMKPMLQRLVHVFYTPLFWPEPLAKLVLLGEALLLERDIRIWNHKAYRIKPVLSEEDASITRYRRWFQQFYDEKEEDKKSLEW